MGRNYIYVDDLTNGHVEAFDEELGREIPYQIVDRKSRDITTCYADPKLANEELGWTAERGIKEMCEDSWRWQSNNPKGYN